MRVIAGKNHGLRLKMVPSKLTRPTTEKVKEALFSIIAPYNKPGIVLDLYAGSGSLGIESVSRGYRKAYLVDHARPAIEVIRNNVIATKSPENFEIIKAPASQAIKQFFDNQIRFDLVIFDPPYAKQHIVKDISSLTEYNLLTEHALIVAETDRSGFNSLNGNLPNGYTVLSKKDYGITYLTVMERD